MPLRDAQGRYNDFLSMKNEVKLPLLNSIKESALSVYGE
jgi:hypothetical protein